MIKLAHQSMRSPVSADDAATRKFVLENTSSGDNLYRWDRTGIQGIQIIDPLAQGWQLTYKPTTGAVPAHLELKAPVAWTNATGPVYVVLELPQEDHDLVITHDFFDLSYTQSIGSLDRFIGIYDHVLSVWDIDPGGSPEVELRTLAIEAGVPSILFTSPEILPLFDSNAVVRTSSTSYAGMVGCGWGRIAGHGLYLGNTAGFATSRKVGFAVRSLSRTGSFGGEIIRIFDIVAKKASGGS